MMNPGAISAMQEYGLAVARMKKEAEEWADDKSVTFATGYLTDRSWWQKHMTDIFQMNVVYYRRQALLKLYPHLENL